jgi:superfamily II helicase
LGAFDEAWALLKQDYPEKIDINTCASCLQEAPLAELENPYNPGNTELCQECWKEEMEWRLEQQRKLPLDYEGETSMPILPWPYGTDEMDLEDME